VFNVEIILGGVLPHSTISVEVERKICYSGFALRTPIMVEPHDFAVYIARCEFHLNMKEIVVGLFILSLQCVYGYESVYSHTNTISDYISRFFILQRCTIFFNLTCVDLHNH